MSRFDFGNGIYLSITLLTHVTLTLITANLVFKPIHILTVKPSLGLSLQSSLVKGKG